MIARVFLIRWAQGGLSKRPEDRGSRSEVFFLYLGPRASDLEPFFYASSLRLCISLCRAVRFVRTARMTIAPLRVQSWQSPRR
jgi:hypothetical protein